jgi:hypothetical protein
MAKKSELVGRKLRKLEAQGILPDSTAVGDLLSASIISPEYTQVGVVAKGTDVELWWDQGVDAQQHCLSFSLSGAAALSKQLADCVDSILRGRNKPEKKKVEVPPEIE